MWVNKCEAVCGFFMISWKRIQPSISNAWVNKIFSGALGCFSNVGLSLSMVLKNTARGRLLVVIFLQNQNHLQSFMWISALHGNSRKHEHQPEWATNLIKSERSSTFLHKSCVFCTKRPNAILALWTRETCNSRSGYPPLIIFYMNLSQRYWKK